MKMLTYYCCGQDSFDVGNFIRLNVLPINTLLITDSGIERNKKHTNNQTLGENSSPPQFLVFNCLAARYTFSEVIGRQAMGRQVMGVRSCSLFLIQLLRHGRTHCQSSLWARTTFLSLLSAPLKATTTLLSPMPCSV